MKNKILAFAAVLFLTASAHAVSDRFGSERTEIPRSSFTDSADLNVVVASISAVDNWKGSFVIRRVSFSGYVGSTVAFYDDTQFTANTSTRAKVFYFPPSNDGRPTTTQLDIYCSSGIMYNKQGTAPMNMNWDYVTPGTWKGIGGDNRP